MKWQLNNIKFPIYNLGKGKRIGIWVQGCTLHCKNCINKTMWNPNQGKSIRVIDIANFIIKISKNYDGITITGGEPFQQYEQLILFLHLIKSTTKLNIQCFTGYELNELNNLFPDKLFYKYVDIIVTGRYIEDKNENETFRGSSNQQIYFFQDGKINKFIPDKNKKVSLNIDKNSDIHMAMIPGKQIINKIENQLNKFNFKKVFK